MKGKSRLEYQLEREILAAISRTGNGEICGSVQVAGRVYSYQIKANDDADK